MKNGIIWVIKSNFPEPSVEKSNERIIKKQNVNLYYNTHKVPFQNPSVSPENSTLPTLISYKLLPNAPGEHLESFERDWGEFIQ